MNGAFYILANASGAGGLPKTGSSESLEQDGAGALARAPSGAGSDSSDKGKTVERKTVATDKEVVPEQSKEEKKKEAAKNKNNVSRIWNMHEGDKFYFFV
ncbi:hypothetical protein T484DRAFT_1921591, partial [Baffinella frigidus]